jgi:hypothetical protein
LPCQEKQKTFHLLSERNPCCHHAKLMSTTKRCLLSLEVMKQAVSFTSRNLVQNKPICSYQANQTGDYESLPSQDNPVQVKAFKWKQVVSFKSDTPSPNRRLRIPVLSRKPSPSQTTFKSKQAVSPIPSNLSLIQNEDRSALVKKFPRKGL